MASRKKSRSNGGKSHARSNQHLPKTIRLFGKHAVDAALQNEARECVNLWCTNKHQQRIVEMGVWPANGQVVEASALAKMMRDDAVHQGIVADFRALESVDLEDVLEAELVLLLDQVTDPHNVGAILRSAAAFGAGAVIQTKDHAAPETAVMAKAASGGLEVIPRVLVTNMVQTMEQLQKAGFWCVGLDGSAEAEISQVPDYDKIALVLGAEGEGMRDSTYKACDVVAKLPMTGAVESLNVSNAAAVSMYALMYR